MRARRPPDSLSPSPKPSQTPAELPLTSLPPTAKVETGPATIIGNLQQSERATIAALRQRISPAEQVAKAIDKAVETAAQASLPQETAFALWQIRQNAINILHSLSFGQIAPPATFPTDGSLPSPSSPAPQTTYWKPSKH